MSKTWANLSKNIEIFFKNLYNFPDSFEQYFKRICTKIESFC